VERAKAMGARVVGRRPSGKPMMLSMPAASIYKWKGVGGGELGGCSARLRARGGGVGGGIGLDSGRLSWCTPPIQPIPPLYAHLKRWVPQRYPCHRPQVHLVLLRHARVHCVMPRVVRPRSDLVEQDAAIGQSEELYAEDTRTPQ
jgi:hypothetical protein